MSRWKEVIARTIDSNAEKLNSVGEEIWKHPELKFEEFHAHDLLTNFLEEIGFHVQRNYILPTAFRAEYTSKQGAKPVVAVLCEYDALPGIGHGCGHNLIAQTGVAAGLAIKEALENDPTLQGKVVVMGTPAEEFGGGKIYMIKGGAFKDVDVAMMAHPSPSDYPTVHLNLLLPVTIKYKGKATHSAATPWDGKNALDAAVACYVNTSLLRQQIKPSWRINAIIAKGGEAPNIIPADSELKYLLRTSSLPDMEDLKRRIDGCFKGAAMATDCDVEVTYHDEGFYKDLLPNKRLEDLYKKHAESLGIVFSEQLQIRGGSSDIGNVTYELPAMHPTFKISDHSNHSGAFTTAAGLPESRAKSLLVAKALAATALDQLSDAQLLADVKVLFLNIKRNC